MVSYQNSLTEYKKAHWQYFGNEVGQFVETVRRIIEFKLTGTYTPVSEKLKIFNEKVLTELENVGKQFPEEYRIVIPRCLYSMYCMRNKRGMIHKSHIDPNKMDATVLLYNTKWVLAELVRLESNFSFEDTENIVESIMMRETNLIWNTGKVLRVLDNKLKTKEKILCLLYVKDGQNDNDLQKSVEYKNKSQFRILLKTMHKDRLIEYCESRCKLSPLGSGEAERIFLK